MFGRNVLQREVRLTVIFLLLLLSNPTPMNANKMNQLPKLPQIVPQNGAVNQRIASSNKIDIHRLYNAYRDRVKDGGDDVKHGTGLIGENPAVAEEEVNDSSGKSLKTVLGGSVVERSEQTSLIGRENSKAESRKKPQLMSSAVNCDAPEDHNVGDLKCVPKQKSKDVEEEKKGRENSDITDPVVKGMVILKMDLPTKDKAEASNAPGKAINSQDSQDAAERRIAELNRVYKEFISAWKKPSTDAKRPNLFVSKPVRLNALSELMNVVENLRQPNTMDDFVKAINAEMTKEREGLIYPDKLIDNMAKTNQLKIERATGIVKRMSGNVNSGEVKTGGLYEQYKNKLNEILKAHKSPSKSFGKGISEISPCHCDAKKPLTLTVDSEGNRISSGQSQCHCDASRFALEGDSTKLSNGVVQCHCDDVKEARLVDHKSEKATDYFEALEACMKVHKEKTVNGGPKPYYISNSKQRQMIWNEIPLMGSGQNKATKTVSKGTAKISAGSQASRQATVKANSPDAKAKSEQLIGNGQQRNVTTLNKNQKQLIHLLKVLQAKHRSATAKRSHKRGLTDSTDRNGNQLGNVGFPQVLVQQVGTGQQAGSRMIDNMAKQLNVSPMEMAQRIAASSSSSSSNSAAAYPLQSNSASQTIGYQVPTNHNKIAPETSNVAPMLEKILSRLQTMQDTNFNRGVEMWAADRLPCCFAEPADGAPCEITGSWESLLLGVRINIVDEHRLVKDAPKPVCAQPQSRDSSSSGNRSWRQCVKMTPKELRERFRAGDMKVLNITIEDTVPPRPHEMLENLKDWIFTGHAISTLGGPVSLSCHKLDSKLMGTFVGFCRNCGCIDTIFGSWTFCQPSKDCQDITMSIFERRDVLRRYSLPEARRERIKDQLYTRSKFAKLEKQQQDEHPTPHPQSG